MSRWLDTTKSNLVTSRQFFDTGMVQQTTDPLLHSTTLSYSPTFAGAYVTHECNALSQCTDYDYDFNTGLNIKITDPNTRITSLNYDSMSRLIQTSMPDGGQATYAYTDSIPAGVTRTTLIDSSVTPNLNAVETTVVDGLARAKQKQFTDPDCTAGPVLTDFTYSFDSNSNRRIETASNPYCQTSDSTYGITIAKYDALGRVRSMTKADGSTVSNTPTGDCTTSTDVAGNSRQSCNDGLERVRALFEHPSGLNYETDYNYDALDNLTAATQKGGSVQANWRVRGFAYDSLSRLTSATNPESGTISYSYNSDGNPSSRVAPQPNQANASVTESTTFSYDALHRVTQKTYAGVTTPTVKYGYDGTAPSGCSPVPPALVDSNPKGRGHKLPSITQSNCGCTHFR